jgi:hypothetical protein
MAEISRADPPANPLTEVYEIGLLLHCICAIAGLGVPDRLARENLELPDLATFVGAREEPLWLVLRFLAAHRLATLQDRQVALADIGHLLCKDHPQSMWSAFAAVGPADAAHALAHTLRTGNAAVEKALGTSFWSHLAAHPEEQEIFDDQMRQHAEEQVSPLHCRLGMADSRHDSRYRRWSRCLARGSTAEGTVPAGCPAGTTPGHCARPIVPYRATLDRSL